MNNTGTFTVHNITYPFIALYTTRNPGPEVSYEYMFLDVVYDQLAVMYLCNDNKYVSGEYTESILVWTRHRKPNTEVINQIKQILQKQNLSFEKLTQLYQTDCYLYFMLNYYN